MFVGSDDGISLREELGLTKERTMELAGIVDAIMVKYADSDDPGVKKGRTSHVLLDINSRHDLSDLEKMVCALMFMVYVYEDYGHSNGGNDSDSRDEELDAVKRRFDVDDDKQRKLDIHIIERDNKVECLIEGSRCMDKKKILDIMMNTMLVLLDNMHEDEVVKFSKAACVRFFMIAETGKV